MAAYESLSIGQELAPLTIGPVTTAHIMRWSAAMENWHRIHYDLDYAREHDKLPGVLVSGSWRQHVLIRYLTDWAGEAGWVWKAGFQFRGMNLAGDALTAWGRITGAAPRGGYGVVTLDLGLRNQKGEEGTPGTATVVLPLVGGRPVPYPFDPAILDA